MVTLLLHCEYCSVKRGLTAYYLTHNCNIIIRGSRKDRMFIFYIRKLIMSNIDKTENGTINTYIFKYRDNYKIKESLK